MIFHDFHDFSRFSRFFTILYAVSRSRTNSLQSLTSERGFKKPLYFFVFTKRLNFFRILETDKLEIFSNGVRYSSKTRKLDCQFNSTKTAANSVAFLLFLIGFCLDNAHAI